MTTDDEPRASRLDGVSALADPARRALYELVAASPEPVTRNAAAAALGIPRSTVALHLDRLAEAGLLVVERRRVDGRTGPGAGRPSKLYRRAAEELVVSIPPRRYDLMGDLLASAIDAALPGERPRDALQRVADARGAEDGRAAGSLDALLASTGYEAVTTHEGTALLNCPFHSLVGTHTEVVCAASHAYLAAAADATGFDAARVRLAPTAGRCCVHIDPPEKTSAP